MIMKTIVIVILSCFLAGRLNAQDSKYFRVDSTSLSVFLKTKGIQIDETTPMQGRYSFDINEKYMDETCKIYKEVFDDIDEEARIALFRTTIVFCFDKKLHINYYYYRFSKRYSSIMLGIEDKLAEYIEKYKKIDLALFIEIKDKENFENASLMLILGDIINYERYPERFRAERIGL